MYIILELQQFSETQLTPVVPIITKNNWNEAESEFHRLCSTAATSNVYRHTIVFMDEEGCIVDKKCYEHKT